MSRQLGAHWERVVYPMVGVVLLLLVWSAVCAIWKMPSAVLPTPLEVLKALISHGPALLSEGWITFKATLYGFLLALFLGIPIAVAVSMFRWANYMFYPL